MLAHCDVDGTEGRDDRTGLEDQAHVVGPVATSTSASWLSFGVRRSLGGEVGGGVVDVDEADDRLVALDVTGLRRGRDDQRAGDDVCRCEWISVWSPGGIGVDCNSRASSISSRFRLRRPWVTSLDLSTERRQQIGASLRLRCTGYSDATRSDGVCDLLTRLDAALRAVTNAERVHLVSTRDRVEHFHVWLYSRSVEHPLRGTEFLNAPQSSDPGEALTVANAVRDQLL